MRTGEKVILSAIVVSTVAAMVVKTYFISTDAEADKGIPYYSVADSSLAREAGQLIRKYSCRDCHSLWSQKNIMQSVPAPALDGLGSLYDEEWFYKYFSAKNPQTIVPTRLKKEFQMPSLADLSEHERRIMAKYMASLKVEDWYLEETKKREYEKLTGKTFVQ